MCKKQKCNAKIIWENDATTEDRAHSCLSLFLAHTLRAQNFCPVTERHKNSWAHIREHKIYIHTRPEYIIVDRKGDDRTRKKISKYGAWETALGGGGGICATYMHYTK